MDYLPIFLKLHGQPCLVIGGGGIASRKVDLLLRAGAHVTVVAPEANETIRVRAKADNGAETPTGNDSSSRAHLAWVARTYKTSDIDGQRLVFAATGIEAVNQRVFDDCQAQAIAVNVVDRTALCSFIMPSIVDRSPVIAAVSTGGNAPALARLLRARLETVLPSGLGALAALAGRYRERVKSALNTVTERRRFWETAFEGEPAELVLAGRVNEAEVFLDEILDKPDPSPTGEVYLVGAGPGDPDLLTFKALRLMQRADVVLYDRLVSQSVLDLVRRDAELIYVGKQRGHHTMRQTHINEHLVELAREGYRVLRLKGGDPFIFGRGGEEIDSLASHNIPFQVVPGITAASGCSAYAGIPLTHRDYAQSCVFVAGHLKDGTVDLNWQALAQPEQTVVFYMGLIGLPVITRQLVAHGLSPQTPAALIQQGTTPEQRVLTATLETLPELVEREKPRPPTLLIVGSVVELHARLGWFKKGAEDYTYNLIQVREPSA